MASDSGNVSRTMIIEIKYFSANNTVIHTENCKLMLNLNCSRREFQKIIVQNSGIEDSAAKREFADHQWKCFIWITLNQVTQKKCHSYCELMNRSKCLERVNHVPCSYE